MGLPIQRLVDLWRRDELWAERVRGDLLQRVAEAGNRLTEEEVWSLGIHQELTPRMARRLFGHPEFPFPHWKTLRFRGSVYYVDDQDAARLISAGSGWTLATQPWGQR